MKTSLMIAGACLFMFSFSTAECRLTWHQKRDEPNPSNVNGSSCTQPDSDLQACLEGVLQLTPDSVACTADCRSALEEYAENCLNATDAQTFREALMSGCGSASNTNGSSCTQPDSNLLACLDLYRRIGPDDDIAKGRICSDCRSGLEDYADRCLPTNDRESFKDQLSIQCGDKSNPCSIDSDRQACFNRFQKLSSSEFDSDNSFCTDCRSDLERYADNCLDKTFAQSANANLTAVCRNASGKSNPCSIDSDRQACLNRFQKLSSSELDSDNSFCTDCRSDLEQYADNCLDKTFAQSANANLTAVCRNASGDANIIGPTLLSTISALLFVFSTVAFN